MYTHKFLAAIMIFMAPMLNAQNKREMENHQFKGEELAVYQAVQKMTKAFHNHDIEGVMASYAPGAVVVFEPEKPIADRAVFEANV